MHNRENQLRILNKWSKEIIEHANSIGGPIMRYIVAHLLRNENNSVNYIKDWIRSAQVYMKNYESHKKDDIRKYLGVGK